MDEVMFFPGLMGAVVAKPDLSALKLRARSITQRAILLADASQVAIAIDTGLDESHVSTQVKRGFNLYTWLAFKNKPFWREIVNFIREEIGLDEQPGDVPLREQVAQQAKRLAEQQAQINKLEALVLSLVNPSADEQSA